jgi:hypothetical protein
MKIINVDEARTLSGFESLSGNSVANMAFRSIRTAAEVKKETSTSVEFRKIHLRKYSIKEGREMIQEKGFKVEVSDNKELIKLHISWFFSSDKEKKLVL